VKKKSRPALYENMIDGMSQGDTGKGVIRLFGLLAGKAIYYNNGS
jgi:hypothetical protein